MSFRLPVSGVVWFALLALLGSLLLVGATSSEAVAAQRGACGFRYDTVEPDAAHPRLQKGVKYYGGCYPAKMKFRLKARPFWDKPDGTVGFGKWKSRDFHVIKKRRWGWMHSYRVPCGRGVSYEISYLRGGKWRWISSGKERRYC